MAPNAVNFPRGVAGRPRCRAAACRGGSRGPPPLPITIDMNGFPNRTRGQVTGPGIDTPIELKAGEEKVVLEKLQPGATYGVDFFHNSGEDSSDFTITINAAGTGVEAVSLGGEKYTM